MKKKNSTILLMMLVFLSQIHAKGKQAFIVGISEYPQYSTAGLQWANIHGTNDAKLLSVTLKKQGFSITALTDKNATASKIRNGLTNFTRNINQGDLVYIHFSGHGQPYEDFSGDEADGWDEAIIPYDAGAKYIAKKYDGKNHIIDDELNKYITAIRKKVGVDGFVYVIIDACHAGGASRGEEEDEDEVFTRGTMIGFSPNNKTYAPRIDARANIQAVKGQGLANVCYLEACRAYQANCEIKQYGQYYGPLSYYINKVLEHNTLSNNLKWIEQVQKQMNSDNRLVNQNMVIEKSK